MALRNGIGCANGSLDLERCALQREGEDASLASPKILHICDKLSVNGSGLHGVGRLLEWWFPEFRARGFDPSVLVLQERDRGGEQLERSGIPVHYLDRSRYDPRALSDAWRHLGQARPALVHLHGYGAWAIGRAAARLRGIPIVLQEHMISERTKLLQRGTDWLLSRSDPTIAISGPVAAFCTERRSVRPEQLRRITNGLPLRAFRPASEPEVFELRGDLKLAGFTPILGSVGRLEPRKGYADLLCAIPEIRRHHPRLGVLIAGDGEDQAELAALAEELGIADCVRLPGYRHDVAALLTLMDVFVVPSHSEGLSLSMLEALAVGRPVVATRVGGLGEALCHEKTALLVPPADPAAIAASALRLLADPALARSLAEAGRALVHEKHDVSANVREIVAVYAELLGTAS